MDWHIISLFFLVLFSFVFLYLDFRYQKIPNIISFVWIFIFITLAFLSWFFSLYWWEFLIRTIILFVVFYFLYLQDRLAWWDFKLYFVLTGFLLIFLYTLWNVKINWLYFDMYIVFYSLVVGFIFLVLRYIFLYVKNWFKFKIDEIIKIKLSNDRKDAVLHFILLTRSLVYTIFYLFLEKYNSWTILVFIVAVSYTHLTLPTIA
jgi:hypothetical protein